MRTECRVLRAEGRNAGDEGTGRPTPFSARAPEQGLEALGGPVPIEERGSHVEHKLFPFFAVGDRFHAVETQKNYGRGHGRALVAIHERVIPAEIKQVRTSDLRQIGERRLAAQGGLRRRGGGMKQSLVSDAARPAKRCERRTVDFFHDLHGEVDAAIRSRAHASFFSVLR